MTDDGRIGPIRPMRPMTLLDSRTMPRFVFGSLRFDSPRGEVIAKNLGEVLAVLDFAEREAKAGAYVGVMLSYEAAPAFDSVLAVHEPSDFPLVWAAAFES